jgi:hypothetical protein|nr:MAG TPA: type I neck protein [Caudoviricetes sp.]
MSFNYSQFRRLRNNFAKLSDSYEEWLQSFLLEEATRFMAIVKPLTPVDTGDLRNHWKIGRIFRQGNTLCVEIINPMDYATFVEYGHSQTPGRYVPQIGKRLVNDWVEGVHMMQISMDRIYAEMPARFNSEFHKWCKGLEVM